MKKGRKIMEDYIESTIHPDENITLHVWEHGPKHLGLVVQRGENFDHFNYDELSYDNVEAARKDFRILRRRFAEDTLAKELHPDDVALVMRFIDKFSDADIDKVGVRTLVKYAMDLGPEAVEDLVETLPASVQ